MVFWGTASQPQPEVEGGLAEQTEVQGSLLTIELWFGRAPSEGSSGRGQWFLSGSEFSNENVGDQSGQEQQE